MIKIYRKTSMKRLTVERFVALYASKFRGLIGSVPGPEWTEEQARTFYEKYSARIWAAVEARGYGHEALEKWLKEKK